MLKWLKKKLYFFWNHLELSWFRNHVKKGVIRTPVAVFINADISGNTWLIGKKEKEKERMI